MILGVSPLYCATYVCWRSCRLESQQHYSVTRLLLHVYQLRLQG